MTRLKQENLDGQLDNLKISRIDPIVETKAYVARVMAARGATLDEAGRALLAEDLRSPCYEEVVVIAAFSHIGGGALQLRRPGYGTHRAHAPPARRDRVLPSSNGGREP